MDGQEIKYSSLEGFNRNIHRFELEDWIVPMAGKSEDVVKQWVERNINLLFIDGWHEYPAVFHDITEWGKFVMPGGIIVAHDYIKLRDAIHDGMKELKGEDLQHIDDNMVFFRG